MSAAQRNSTSMANAVEMQPWKSCKHRYSSYQDACGDANWIIEATQKINKVPYMALATFQAGQTMILVV